MERTEKAMLFGVAAGLATALPLFAFLIKFGVAAPLSLFQGDAFYYLDITRYSAGRPGFTFDGRFTTNGFHPLWQYVLSFFQWLGWLHIENSILALTRTFVVDVVLLSIGAGLFTVFATRQLRRPALALLVVSPGVLWFLVTPFLQSEINTWSYANGLESGLSLAMMSLALTIWRKTLTGKRYILFSVCLAFAVLARLDDIFFLLAIGVVTATKRPLPARKLALLFLPASAIIGCYLLYNYRSVGAFLPLSGAAKMGLGLRVNLGWTLKLIVPMFTSRTPRVLNPSGAWDAFPFETDRAFQMCVPVLICLIHLTVRCLRERSSDLVKALCGGVILKGVYNFVFVAGGHQGFWYYTVSIAAANLICVMWLDVLLERYGGWLPGKAMQSAGYCCLVLYSFSAFYGTKSQGWGPERLRLLQDGPKIAEGLRQQGIGCLIEFDDGIVSFALGIPTESGFGLALDAPASEVLREGRFLPLMQHRACLTAATFSYGESNQAYIDHREWEQGKPLWSIAPSEFRDYSMVDEGAMPRDSLTFFRFVPLR